jgi:hypothetical protein
LESSLLYKDLRLKTPISCIEDHWSWTEEEK